MEVVFSSKRPQNLFSRAKVAIPSLSLRQCETLSHIEYRSIMAKYTENDS
jgi:hypothetical protein